jgi:hypothetical protein
MQRQHQLPDRHVSARANGGPAKELVAWDALNDVVQPMLGLDHDSYVRVYSAKSQTEVDTVHLVRAERAVDERDICGCNMIEDGSLRRRGCCEQDIDVWTSSQRPGEDAQGASTSRLKVASS